MIKRLIKFFNLPVLTAAILPVVLAAVFFFIRYNLTTIPITIIYTNDIHGNLLPKNGKGGMAAIANFVKNSRKKDPDLLLADAGDFFQGTPESDLTGGKNTILIMNLMGYDAATIGNHEFDFGQQNLSNLSKIAKFPFLSANIYLKDKISQPSYIKPYIIKEIKGIRVAVFGLTSDETPSMSIPRNIQGLYFADPITTSQNLLKNLNEKADVVIALSHLGIEKSKNIAAKQDISLAKQTPGQIDVIIGGHTHSEVKGLKVGKTFVVQTSGLGRSVGKLTIRVDKKSKKPILITNSITKISPSKTGEDPEIKKHIAEISTDITKQLSSVIGEATDDIRRMSGDFSPLSALIADIMRQKSKSQIAFQNRGGVRDDIRKGKITLGNIYLVSPFDNTIVTMKLSGATIRSLIEKSISNRKTSKGAAVLDFSGIKIIQRSDGKSDIVLSDGKKLDDKVFYTVGTNSFLAEGGDGFNEFRGGLNKNDTGIKVRDSIVEYILKNKKISPPIATNKLSYKKE